MGTVEIRPTVGISAPVSISMVTISLQRRETIHPSADSVTKKHLAAPRKELTDIVGREMLLFRCPAGKEYENVYSMDLPFVLFLPFGRGGEEVARRIPPASLQLPRRTAETYYELVVSVQQGYTEQKKYPFPVPLARYDTLSTFGMYNRPESAEGITDHIVMLGISLPRWSYGPLDPVSVYIKLSPNPECINKARKVTIQKITIGIEEVVVYNHEGDEPQKKVKIIAKQTQAVGVKMPEAGYFTNLGLVFPAKDLRDNDGILPRNKQAFPMYSVSGFTTSGSLYKVEYFLTVKVSPSTTRQPAKAQPPLTPVIPGTYDGGKGHPPPPTHHRLPPRPRRLQRRNGSHRTSGQGCRARRSGEPHAARSDDRTHERLQRPAHPRHDDGRADPKTAHRVKDNCPIAHRETSVCGCRYRREYNVLIGGPGSLLVGLEALIIPEELFSPAFRAHAGSVRALGRSFVQRAGAGGRAAPTRAGFS